MKPIDQRIFLAGATAFAIMLGVNQARERMLEIKEENLEYLAQFRGVNAQYSELGINCETIDETQLLRMSLLQADGTIASIEFDDIYPLGVTPEILRIYPNFFAYSERIRDIILGHEAAHTCTTEFKLDSPIHMYETLQKIIAIRGGSLLIQDPAGIKEFDPIEEARVAYLNIAIPPVSRDGNDFSSSDVIDAYKIINTRYLNLANLFIALEESYDGPRFYEVGNIYEYLKLRLGREPNGKDFKTIYLVCNELFNTGDGHEMTREEIIMKAQEVLEQLFIENTP